MVRKIKRLLCQNLPSIDRPVLLSEEETHHAKTVLRLKDGEFVDAIDGKGSAVRCRLEKEKALFILKPIDSPRQDKPFDVIPLILEAAILKSPAMEWLIEKSTELGVDQVIPILTERTIVQIQRKGPEAFQKRWQRIADQTLKQCGRLKKMEVLKPTSMTDRLKTSQTSYPLIVVHPLPELPSLDSYLQKQENLGGVRVLIGPEGGWSPKEISAFKKQKLPILSLGPLTLRAETAGLIVAGLISQFFRNYKSENASR